MASRIYVLVAVILAFSATAIAGEKENQLIAKVTQAYGGDSLINLKSYTIVDHFLTPTTGQSHSPDLLEVSSSKQVLNVDIENNRATYDTWSEGRSGSSQGATISNGEQAYSINYQAGTYGPANNADPHVFAGGTMRTSDTVLVYELNKVKDKVALKDDADFMNRPHHVLSMPFPSSPDLNLYIDASTFLISKMVRENPNLGDLSYVFSGHTNLNGITSASAINFFVAGQPSLISTKHALSFNQGLPAASVALPSGLTAEGERIDDATMVVNKLSDRLYHIGQNGGYSLFADTSMGIVAAGGYPGLSNRLDHFQQASETFKPLAYQIVTHHHSDHIGGLGEAVELGAKIVTVADNIDTVKASITPTPDNRSFYKSGARTTLGSGRNRVEVYEISTSHAASYLVMYSPSEKTVFIADHYGSPFAKGLPTARLTSVEMLSELEKLNIEIKKITTAHNARVFTMKELRDSAAKYQPTVCSANRPVCA